MSRAKFRWRVARERDLYPKCGFGAWFERGCTGTTYGEEGTNQFATVAVLLICWQFALHMSWKDCAND